MRKTEHPYDSKSGKGIKAFTGFFYIEFYLKIH